MMVAFSFTALALLVPSVLGQNMLRFACSQLVVERTDPIVFPGTVFTPHVHQIVGGNSFNVTMDPATHDPATLSTCTSCSFIREYHSLRVAEDSSWSQNNSHKPQSFASGCETLTLIPNTRGQEQLLDCCDVLQSSQWILSPCPISWKWWTSRNSCDYRAPVFFFEAVQPNADSAMMQINNGGLDVYYIPSGKTTAFAKGFRMVAGSATNTDVSKVNGGNICHRFVTRISSRSPGCKATTLS